jgi:hypothetical protein
MPLQCRTKKKKDGEEYTTCYEPGGGSAKKKKGRKSSGPVKSEGTLLKEYGGNSVAVLNAHLDKTKGTSGKFGRSKGDKLLKIQEMGSLGSLPKKAGGAKKKHEKPKQVSASQARSAATNLRKIVSNRAGMGDRVGQKPPGDR